MNPHALSMTVFVEVARAGSFSAAAHRLNLSTTAVSRHVADLERMLGVTLLRRTTRHVSPTEAGARYLPRARAILEEIEQLNAEISAVGVDPCAASSGLPFRPRSATEAMVPIVCGLRLRRTPTSSSRSTSANAWSYWAAEGSGTARA